MEKVCKSLVDQALKILLFTSSIKRDSLNIVGAATLFPINWVAL